jgi:hypothetical protein
MKRSFVFSACISMFAMAACNRHKDDMQYEATKAMLLGKWQFEKGIDEVYEPANVLKEHEEEIGTPGDSIIFKIDNNIYDYRTLATGVDEDVYPYKLINDSTLITDDDEQWRIRKLTSNELNVYQEEIENNKKTITIGYYKR